MIKSEEPVAPSAALVSPTKSIAEGAEESFLSDSSSQASAEEVAPVLEKTEHKIKEEQGLLEDEPLLKSNPHRFVIFPIQDNDVSRFVGCAFLAKTYSYPTNPNMFDFSTCSYGKCTKRLKHPSGPLKKLIWEAIWSTGSS